MEKPVKKNNSYCSVPQCRSKGASVSFHRFPNEDSTVAVMRLGRREVINRRNEWVRALKIGKKVTKRMSVCSLHFEKSDYLYPDMPRLRKRLKRTAVPSLNLPVFSTQNAGTLKKKETNATVKQQGYDNWSTKRPADWPGKDPVLYSCDFKDGKKENGPTVVSWDLSKQNCSGDPLKMYSHKEDTVFLSDQQSSSYADFSNKTKKICVISSSSGNVILRSLATILKTPAAAALNKLSQKVPEEIFPPSGCATTLAHSSPPELSKNYPQARVGLPSESIVLGVETDVPEECAFQNIGDNEDCIKSNSRKTLTKQLNCLQQQIDDLKIYANQLKLKHTRLVWEQQSPLVKNVHAVKQNAVDGDLDAIILLNRMVSYNTTQA